MIIKKLKNKSGFVLLFAVTLSAILLAIALGVSNIALKEINFSTSARDSNEAFFAADVGAECALYEDKNNKFPAQTTNPNLSISCNNNAVPTFSTSGTTSTYGFTTLALGNTNKSCVKVTVFKEWFADTSIVNTLITSRGYNLGGDGSCADTSSRLVERELDVRYGTHRNIALGKIVTGIGASPNVASNLTDGDYTTQARPGASGVPNGKYLSFEVDLGSSSIVSQIRVVLCRPTHVAGNNGCYGYPYDAANQVLGDGNDAPSPYIDHWKIEGYDGSYSTLAESAASPNGVPNSHKIEISLPANTTLQKIKISAESTVNWIGLYELEAY